MVINYNRFGLSKDGRIYKERREKELSPFSIYEVR
jgi:hypothetical protein